MTYLLHNLVVAGGVLSVIQLVNEVDPARRGSAHRGAVRRSGDLRLDPLYTQPLVFRNERELLRNFPDSDITVATLWSTAPGSPN